MNKTEYFYLNEAGERIITRVPPGHYLLNKVTGKVFPPNSRAGWRGINIDKDSSDWEFLSIKPVNTSEAKILKPKITRAANVSKTFDTLEFDPILPILEPLLGADEAKKATLYLEDAYGKTIETLMGTAKSILQAFYEAENNDPSLSVIRSEEIFLPDLGKKFFISDFLKDLEDFIERGHGLKGKVFSTKSFSTNSLFLLTKRMNDFLYFLSEKFYEKDIAEKKLESPEKAIDYFFYSKRTNTQFKQPLFIQEVYSLKEKLNQVNAALKHIDYLLGTILKSTAPTSKPLSKEFVKILFFENIESLQQIVDSFDKEVISFAINDEIGLLDSVKAAVLANVPYLFRDIMDKASTYVPGSVKTSTTDTGVIISFTLQNQNTQTTFDYAIEVQGNRNIAGSFIYRKLREPHYMKDFYGLIPRLGKKAVIVNVKFSKTITSNAGKQTETAEVPLKIEIAGSFAKSGYLQLSAHVKRLKKFQPEKIHLEQKKFKRILGNLDTLYKDTYDVLFSGGIIDGLYTDKGMDHFGIALEFLALYPLLKSAKAKAEETGDYSEAYREFSISCLDTLFGRKFLLSKDEQKVFEQSISVDYEDQSVKVSLPKLAQLSLIQLDDLYDVYVQQRPAAGDKIFDFMLTSNEQSMQELNSVNFLKNLFRDPDKCSAFLKKVKDILNVLANEYYNKLQANVPLELSEQELYTLVVSNGEITTALTSLDSSYKLNNPQKFVKTLFEKLQEIRKPRYQKDFVKAIKGSLLEAVAESLFEELITSSSNNTFENHNFIAALQPDGKILIKVKSSKALTAGFGDIRMYLLDPKEQYMVPVFLELKATSPKVQSVYSLKEAYVEFIKLSHNLPEIAKNLGINVTSKIKVPTMLPLTLGVNLHGNDFMVDFSEGNVQSTEFVSSSLIGNFKKLVSNFVKVRDYGLIGPSLFSSEVVE